MGVERRAGSGQRPSWLAFLLAALLLPALPLPAQDLDEEPSVRQEAGLRVVVDSTWARPRSGYPFAVRVRIDNLGSAREVECVVEGQGRWDTGDTRSVKRSFHLDEKEKVRFELLVPCTSYEYLLRLFVNGEPRRKLSFHIGGGVEAPCYLVVDQRSSLTPRQLTVALWGSGWGCGFSSGSPWTLLSSDRLSEAWQAYAGLRGIWVRAADWDAIPEPQGQAILRAVLTGTPLVLYALDPCHQEEACRLLFGENRPARLRTPDAPGLGASFYYGLGLIRAIEEDLDRSTPLSSKYLVGGKGCLQAAFEGNLIETQGLGKIPYSAFLWIIVFFSVLIGPANFFLVHRMGNRLLFLVTSPLIAAVAVLTLVGYSVLYEGFGIKVAVQSLTLLDPNEKEAVIVSRQTIYSGLATGTWSYQADTLVLAQPELPEYHYEYGPRYWGPRRRPQTPSRAFQIDWTRGQEISGGWVPARTPSRMATVQVVPSRSRLSVERVENGELLVRNGLGATILEGIVFLDGRYYELRELEDGESAKVAHTSGFIKLNAVWMMAFAPEVYALRDGMFQALCDRNSLLDQGGKELDQLDEFSAHLVVGTITEYQ